MKTAIIALTKNGTQTAIKLGKLMKSDIYVKYPHEEKGINVFSLSLKELVKDIFDEYEAFILIMATGIAFRTFAPYIKTKDCDPALIVMDEKAQFAISLLSGHLGGANELTQEIAELIGAIPVITTATDVNKTIAFDLVAKKNNCAIENIGATKFISGALVNGETISLHCPYPILGQLPKEVTDYTKDPQENVVTISNKIEQLPQNHVLYLRPKNLVLGIGCRRNTPFSTIEKAFTEFMSQEKYSILSIKAIASIDLKKGETGILALAEKYKLPFITFTAEDLNKYTIESDGSQFVKETTGTASVSQSAALAMCKNGKTVIKKTICQGITLSLAEEITEIRI
ncbi:MAG: cobalt-precorrin 5A hydrolase [Clostridiales bacterium]